MSITILCCGWLGRLRVPTPKADHREHRCSTESHRGGRMEFTLKAISPEGIDAALSKAELYRFLNEPEEAESICQDVLVVQPGHQLALRLLGLAITDQFTGNPADRYSEAEH